MNTHIYSFMHVLSYMSQERFKDLIIGCIFKNKGFWHETIATYFYF